MPIDNPVTQEEWKDWNELSKWEQLGWPRRWRNASRMPRFIAERC